MLDDFSKIKYDRQVIGKDNTLPTRKFKNRKVETTWQTKEAIVIAATSS